MAGIFAQPRRISELDGLRGIAVLSVIAWHFFVMPSLALRAAGDGAFSVLRSGVDLFFVLSGYLIGGILLRNEKTGQSLRAFYWRRAIRILPLYFAWFLIFFALPRINAVPPLFFADNIPRGFYLGLVQNFAYAFQNSFGSEWMGITWSLCVGEQFYLLLPLLVWFLPRRLLLGALAASLIACPIIRYLLIEASFPVASYVLLPARADSLAIGILLAHGSAIVRISAWLSSHKRIVAGISAACFVLVLLNSREIRTWNLQFSLLAICYAGVISIATHRPPEVLSKILLWKPLQSAGTLAYGLYLTHQGLNTLIHHSFRGARPAAGDLFSFSLTLISLGTVFLVAHTSYRLFEEPLLSWARFRFPYGGGEAPAQAKTLDLVHLAEALQPGERIATTSDAGRGTVEPVGQASD